MDCVKDLLDQWLTSRGWTNRRLAEALHERHSTVFPKSASAIEKWMGDKIPDPHHQALHDPYFEPEELAAIDAALGAGGAFEDMAWAIGYGAMRDGARVTGPLLAPSRRWEHNFNDHEGAVWIWVRTHPASTGSSPFLTIHCGPGSFQLRGDPSGRSFLCHLPICFPALPFIVELERPGTVDFGRGVVPTDLDADSMIHFGVLTDAAMPSIGERPAPRADGLRATLHANARESQRWLGFLTNSGDGSIWSRWNSGGRAIAQVASTQPVSNLEELRIRRGFSRRELCDLLNPQLGEHAFTAATFLSFEKSPLALSDHPRDRVRRTAQLVAVDMALGCDGRLAQFEVPCSPEEHDQVWNINFPPGWIGPAWVRCTPRAGSGVTNATLWWGEWTKDLEFFGDSTVVVRQTPGSTSRGDALSIVFADAGWMVSAGVGRGRSGIDGVSGWKPSLDQEMPVIAQRTSPAISELRRHWGPAHPGANQVLETLSRGARIYKHLRTIRTRRE